MIEKFVYSREKAEGEAVSKVETHTPEIECPDVVKAGEPFDVRISVAKHPNKPEHSIRYVDVFFAEEGRAFNPVWIARVKFSEYTEQEAVLKLKLQKSGTIIALAYCNLHGLWENYKEVRVE
ncbi:class II SORL domain-containing protein [Archaeoglobus sp.]